MNTYFSTCLAFVIWEKWLNITYGNIFPYKRMLSVFTNRR